MSKEHSGFIIGVKQPTREGHVACLVITPKFKGGEADVSAKVERNLGRTKAIELSLELLVACNIPEELLVQIRALSLESK